jgi:hypothetical protein
LQPALDFILAPSDRIRAEADALGEPAEFFDFEQIGAAKPDTARPQVGPAE